MRCPNFISKTPPGHAGWPKLVEYSYPSLPLALQRLRMHGGQISFEDQPDLFSRESSLRPEWIGIVDVQQEGRGG